jgi:phosphoketolase
VRPRDSENGYKIANPTILARIRPDELHSLFAGYGYKPYLVEGDDPRAMHQLMAATLDKAGRDSDDPERGPRRWGASTPILADDHFENAQGLDGSQGSRRA